MRRGPYSIYTDGSNDNNLQKMMPLTISVADEKSAHGVSTEFLDMGLCTSTTAEGLLVQVFFCVHLNDWIMAITCQANFFEM